MAHVTQNFTTACTTL